MKHLILLLALPALAACSSPRETCLKAATKDLAVVDRLIAETQANLSRGYGIERETYVSNSVDLCLGSGRPLYGRHNVGVGWTYCNRPTTKVRRTPVAIDQAAERRKLNELKQTRARLVKETQSQVTQCNRLYPAG